MKKTPEDLVKERVKTAISEIEMCEGSQINLAGIIGILDRQVLSKGGKKTHTYQAVTNMKETERVRSSSASQSTPQSIISSLYGILEEEYRP